MHFVLVLPIRSRCCPFDFSVCVVEEDSCNVSFVDFDGLLNYTHDIPCVPSVYGNTPGIVSMVSEQQALDAIENSIISLSQKYDKLPPDQYEKLYEPRSGGFVVHVCDGRIKFEISEWECRGFGWQRGDRVSLSSLPDASRFVLHLDRDGYALMDAEKSGWLTVNKDWSLGSHDIRDQDSPMVEYYLSDSGVYFGISKDAADKNENENIIDFSVTEKSSRTPDLSVLWLFPFAAFLLFVLALSVHYLDSYYL